MSLFYILPATAFIEEKDSDKLLGAIVKDYTDPIFGQRKTIPGQQPVCLDVVISNDDCKVAKIARTRSNPGISLESFTNVERTSSENVQLELSCDRLWQRRILDLEEYSQKAFAEQAFVLSFNSWIRRIQKERTACMITGLLLCENPKIEELRKQVKGFRAELVVPLLEIVSAVLGVPLPISTGNPGVKYDMEGDRQTDFKGARKGSIIVGISYKWIEWPLFADKPRLRRTGPSGFGKATQLAGDDSSDDAEAEDEQLDEKAAQVREANIRDGYLQGGDIIVQEVDWSAIMDRLEIEE